MFVKLSENVLVNSAHIVAVMRDQKTITFSDNSQLKYEREDVWDILSQSHAEAQPEKTKEAKVAPKIEFPEDIWARLGATGIFQIPKAINKTALKAIETMDLFRKSRKEFLAAWNWRMKSFSSVLFPWPEDEEITWDCLIEWICDQGVQATLGAERKGTCYRIEDGKLGKFSVRSWFVRDHIKGVADSPMLHSIVRTTEVHENHTIASIGAQLPEDCHPAVRTALRFMKSRYAGAGTDSEITIWSSALALYKFWVARKDNLNAFCEKEGSHWRCFKAMCSTPKDFLTMIVQICQSNNIIYLSSPGSKTWARVVETARRELDVELNPYESRGDSPTWNM